MGLPLANVQNNDTFQTWLTRTNQIIVSTPNTQYVAANTYVNDQITQLSGLLSSNVVSINSEISQLSGLLTSNVNTINSSITNLSGLLTSNVSTINSSIASLEASAAANTYVNALLANTNAYIATKLDIAGGSITNSLTVQQNLTVDGNLTVNGNTTVINVENFRVQDSIIYLAGNNYVSDTLDIGFVANYNDGTWANQHTGFIRDSGTKKYYLFSKYELELEGNNNVDITHPSFRLADLNVAGLVANTYSGNGASITSLNATELTSGTLPAARLPLTGVTANTYGSGSLVPQITVDATGRVTEINNINVAGVTNFTFTTGNTTFTISTADGNSFSANIADDSIALGTKTTGNYVATVANTDSNIVVSGSGSETAAVSIGLATNISVGGIVTAVDFNSTSDARLKENVAPIQDPLNKVLQLAGVEFDWKESGEHSIGVIAQQVEQIVPELVHTNENGFKTVSYGKLTGLLIEAIKELKTIVDSK